MGDRLMSPAKEIIEFYAQHNEFCSAAPIACSCGLTQLKAKALTQLAEADARIAAAYEDAAQQSDGWNIRVDHPDGTMTNFGAHLRSRTPADAQKAMAEHDAALRAELERAVNINNSLTTHAADREQHIAKLEAENAGLREQLNRSELRNQELYQAIDVLQDKLEKKP